MLSALLMTLTIGFIFQHLYLKSPDKPYSINQFRESLFSEIELADQFYKQIIDDSLYLNPVKITKQTGHEFYIYKNENLIFWSSNRYEISDRDFNYLNHWQILQTGNAYVLGKWHRIDNQYKILGIIPVKSAYAFENKYLANEFNSKFHLNKDINISTIPSPDFLSVNDSKGHFLFGISAGKTPAYNEFYQYAGFISFCFAFLIVLILYTEWAKKLLRKSLTQYCLLSISVLSLILILCYFDFPGLLFNNPVFSPVQFAINGVISSFTHLTILTLYSVTAIYIFTNSKKKINITAGSIIALLLLFLFFELLKSLVFHSGINFNILNIKELKFIQLWSHLLVFISGMIVYLWGKKILWNEKHTTKTLLYHLSSILIISIIISLITGGYYHYFSLIVLAFVSGISLKLIVHGRNSGFLRTGIFIILMTIASLFITLRFNQNKKDIRYRVLSENILINGNAENDPIAELLIEEMHRNMSEDNKLSELVNLNDSLNSVRSYIFDRYLRGFWNNFDVGIFRISSHSEDYKNYLNFLNYSGMRIKETGFYTLPASLYDLSIAGMIRINNADSVLYPDKQDIIILEFQPKRTFRSYSFPDLLISKEADLIKKSEISIARFNHQELIYHDNRYNWEKSATLFSNIPEGFRKINQNNEIFYVFSNPTEKIVIREINLPEKTVYLIYFLSVIISYLLIWRILEVINIQFVPGKKLIIGLTSRFQMVFITLLLISFIGILIFSVRYFRSNYQQEQIEQINKKKAYIQQSLQDMYFWTGNIADISEQSLNNTLTELAFRFETDINIYNIDGKLMGSSQNLIFKKNLMSKLMSPEAFFSGISSPNQYEKIGKLEYLSAYTEFLNGDYLKIGYIAIPQYLSQTEINSKIESFLFSIIQIYVLIAILSLIFILIAGKQLAEPIQQLELKLKSMRIGGKNEKIDYKINDEIGHLVEQYNKTVDELEKSTRLLIQSERETAWRTMARQIAHEINNPLTPMKLTIQQLQRTRKMQTEDWDEYFDKASKTLVEQIDNLSRIAGTFSQFARLPETRFTKTDVASKLSSAISLFKNNHEQISIDFEGDSDNIYVLGDGEQLIQVFNNLLKNALQSIPGEKEGKIKIILETIEDEVIITVADNGTGIPVKNQEVIFKPNFTTKSTGMGLGLSISKNIIENMQGEISFESVENEGSRFFVRLKKIKTIEG